MSERPFIAAQAPDTADGKVRFVSEIEAVFATNPNYVMVGLERVQPVGGESVIVADFWPKELVR